MNKIQFLISFIAIIPLFALISIPFIKKDQKFISKFTMSLALIMLFNILNLSYNYDGNLNSISLLAISDNFDLGLSVTNISLIIAAIVTFIWFVITFYSNKNFIFSNDKRFFNFQIFSISLILLITLVIFSKNLVSLILFYQLLVILLYFFNNYFSSHKEFAASNNFSLISLIGSFFMLIAIFATYKIAGNIEFTNNGILNNVSSKKQLALLLIFIMAICPIALFPVYLFYKKLYILNSPMIIISFIISYGLVSLIILLKIILNIFGFSEFIKNIHQFNFSYILNFIVGINLLFSGIFMVLQNNIKKIMLHLLFNQLIFAIFLFLILHQAINQFIITVIAFILSQSLIFLSLGNINLYLMKAKEKTLAGIFYKLKYNTILLIFAFGSIVGAVPAIGMVEKWIFIQNYLINEFDFNLLIIFTNIILILISVIRIISPLFAKDKNINEEDNALALRIDRDLSLISPSIIIASLMLIFFIFSGLINGYLKLFLI